MEIPKTELVDISSIKKNPDNPRIIKDANFKNLVSSIKAFPQMLRLRPIVVDSEGVILGGNMRFEACSIAGINPVPVTRAEGLTEEQRREFIIKDNVAADEWDFDRLMKEWNLELLKEWGLDDLQFPEDTPEAIEDNFEFNENEIVTNIVCGDILEIGRHRLMCGDSAVVDDVMKLMAGKKADMIFTDPPYGVAYKGKTKSALTIENDDISEEELQKINSEWFNCVDIVAKEGAYLLATVPAGPLHLVFASDWKRRGWLRQILVWNKSSMVLGHSEYHYKHEPILFGWKPGSDRFKCPDRTKTSVWDFDKPLVNKEHPTMKPVKMWEYGIKNHCRLGELLYEPFGGSGTAMVACEQIGRTCFSMEIDPRYCQVIVNRMRALDSAIPIMKNGEPYVG